MNDEEDQKLREKLFEIVKRHQDILKTEMAVWCKDSGIPEEHWPIMRQMMRTAYSMGGHDFEERQYILRLLYGKV